MFQVGDLVLIWDTRRVEKGNHGKFDPLWNGPYKISEARSNNTFMLEDIDEEAVELPVNGYYLKHYFQHLKAVSSLLYIFSFLSLYISHQAIFDSMPEVKSLICKFLLFRSKKRYPQVEPNVVDHMYILLFFQIFENIKIRNCWKIC